MVCLRLDIGLLTLFSIYRLILFTIVVEVVSVSSRFVINADVFAYPGRSVRPLHRGYGVAHK